MSRIQQITISLAKFDFCTLYKFGMLLLDMQL